MNLCFSKPVLTEVLIKDVIDTVMEKIKYQRTFLIFISIKFLVLQGSEQQMLLERHGHDCFGQNLFFPLLQCFYKLSVGHL